MQMEGEASAQGFRRALSRAFRGGSFVKVAAPRLSAKPCETLSGKHRLWTRAVCHSS